MIIDLGSIGKFVLSAGVCILFIVMTKVAFGVNSKEHGNTGGKNSKSSSGQSTTATKSDETK